MTGLQTAMQLGLKAGVSMILIGLSQGCTSDAATDAGQQASDDATGSPGSDGDVVPAACDDIVGEGNALGQIAENWTSLGRDGNPVNLYDHCGKVIFYENGAEW